MSAPAVSSCPPPSPSVWCMFTQAPTTPSHVSAHHSPHCTPMQSVPVQGQHSTAPLPGCSAHPNVTSLQPYCNPTATPLPPHYNPTTTPLHPHCDSIAPHCNPTAILQQPHCTPRACPRYPCMENRAPCLSWLLCTPYYNPTATLL